MARSSTPTPGSSSTASLGPYIPDSEFSPIWNPEFFGNMIIANGNTWPFQVVEQRRYRLRFLNGCQSRFLILDFGNIPGVEVWQIGNEGGFLAAPVNLTAINGNHLLMGLAERADVIVDFTKVPVGSYVLGNLGPDEPFGGGIPGVGLRALPIRSPPARSWSSAWSRPWHPTRRHRHSTSSCRPSPRCPPESLTRPLALIEKAGIGEGEAGEPPEEVEIEGPIEAQLGNVVDGLPVSRHWGHEITENPTVGSTEVWEFYNTTADAHPMHVHEVTFQVVNREGLVLDQDEDEVALPIQLDGNVTPPEAGRVGLQGHRHRLPRPGNQDQGEVRLAGPVRLALPHRRARGQRDDAALPHRPRTARPTHLPTSPARHRLVAGTHASWPGGRTPCPEPDD